MSSFWSQSDGTSATKNVETSYDAGGGQMELIPDGSTVSAFIKKAEWKEGREQDGYPNYINIQWTVEEPDILARRVVFQKLWVKDNDPNAKDPAAKRDKALKMLATIDANAGGKLAAAGEQPTDDSLALALNNKGMVISVKVWEMETATGKMDGNWVAAVHPKGTELKVPDTGPVGGASRSDDLDDDIPF